MPPPRPPVIMRCGTPLVLPRGYRRDPAYRALHQGLRAARTFADVIRLLEHAVTTTPQIAVDLLPREPWAQRFVYTIGREAARAQPTPRQRRTATRGQHVLLALLLGTARRLGRKPSPPPTAAEVSAIACAHAAWRAHVTDFDLTDRDRLRRGIRDVARTRWGTWGAAHDRALTALCRKERLRPSDVIPPVVAWELGISARQVRRALIAPPTALVHR